VREFQELTGNNREELLEAECNVCFVVPATGDSLFFIQLPDGFRLSSNFGNDLVVVGDSEYGPFRLECPEYYVQSVSDSKDSPGWAIARPVNRAVRICYGESREITTVTATINNFDFEYGNHSDAAHVGSSSLRVQAEGRAVEFKWRSDRRRLQTLVESNLISMAAFVDFEFSAWNGASDTELTEFADDISSLCTLVAGQQTGIPVLSLYDSNGKVVRRTIRCPIESQFRRGSAFRPLHAPNAFPKLIEECLGEHRRMQRSELWRRLPSLYAVIGEPPYLEQKFATLMMAVELLIRSSLIEANELSLSAAEEATLPKLVSMARAKLRWNMPKHYTEHDRYRKSRNAVDHGAVLPYDVRLTLADFQKWKLFLLRRIFIRLGFDGSVASPQNGWAGSSAVDEFSADHNSFGP
jgi:hypothetical protein